MYLSFLLYRAAFAEIRVTGVDVSGSVPIKRLLKGHRESFRLHSEETSHHLLVLRFVMRFIFS